MNIETQNARRCFFHNHKTKTLSNIQRIKTKISFVMVSTYTTAIREKRVNLIHPLWYGCKVVYYLYVMMHNYTEVYQNVMFSEHLQFYTVCTRYDCAQYYFVSTLGQRRLVSCHLEIDVTYISKHYQANNFFVLPHNSKYLPFRF